MLTEVKSHHWESKIKALKDTFSLINFKVQIIEVSKKQWFKKVKCHIGVAGGQNIAKTISHYLNWTFLKDSNSILFLNISLIENIFPGFFQAQPKIVQFGRVGEDSGERDNVRCLQSWTIHFLLRTFVRGKSWYSTVWWKIHWIWTNAKHSGL